jgi:predicted nucleic acid-binding Zn ribbon protein
MNSTDNNERVLRDTQLVLNEVCGEEIGAQILPQFLKNRTLTVNCLSSTAADVIRTRQQEIVDKINEKLAKKEVDRIRYLL